MQCCMNDVAKTPHLGEARPELPDVNHLIRCGDDVVVRDCQVLGLNLDVLAVYRAADGVTEDEDELARVLPLSGVGLSHSRPCKVPSHSHFCCQHAKVPERLNGNELAHILGVLVVVPVSH